MKTSPVGGIIVISGTSPDEDDRRAVTLSASGIEAVKNGCFVFR